MESLRSSMFAEFLRETNGAGGHMPSDEEERAAIQAEVKPAPDPFALPRFVGADIARPLPKLDYLIPRLGMVSGGGAPHMIAGYGFSGKTLALQVALLCLAAGRKVWGAFDGPGRPLRVAHVDAEQGEALTLKRYQRAAHGHGIDLVADCGDRLNVFCALKLPDGSRLQLTAKHADYWRRIMDGLDLVVVDSLAALSAGTDENSRDQRAGLDLLGTISEETKCRATVIHHATKPPQMGADRASRYSIRGSGAIYDAVDSAYVFSGEKGESVRVEHVKARSHGEPTDDFALSFSDVEHNGDAKFGVMCSVFGCEVIDEQRERLRALKDAAAAARALERVLAALRGGPLDQATLKAKARVDGVTLAAALASAQGRVIIESVKDGRSWKKMHRLGGT